ncbi:MAG: glycosyltransferase family 2 protein [Eggerthellaceae bacterium]
MPQKKASIIVPCYNVEKYLPRCLDSLVNQTLQDIEIICINDGSPDHCIDILRKYERRFPDVIVIIDKQNEGVWRGRFDAIAIAQGEYIGFVDSDDYVEPNFAEKLYSAASADDSDIAVCGFHRIDVDSNKILNTEMVDVRPSFYAQQEPERLLELNGAPWNKFFRASILKNLHDFEVPPKIFDDMMLHLLAYPSVKKVTFTPHALVNYIIRNDSIMTTIDKSKIESTYNAMLEVKDVYEHIAPKSLIDFLDAAAFLHLGISLMFRISYDPTVNLSSELEQNKMYLSANFPTWNTSAVISAHAAKKNGGALRKAYFARKIYNSPFMPLAVKIYRTMIHNLPFDIKW